MCSVVTAPEFKWEPLSRCKYCAVSLQVCIRTPVTFLLVALWPHSKAAEGKAQSLRKPSSVLATFILLLYSKERDFYFVSPAKRYLRVCMCACDRERAGGRESGWEHDQGNERDQTGRKSINKSFEKTLSCLLTRLVLADFLTDVDQKASKAEPLP